MCKLNKQAIFLMLCSVILLAPVQAADIKIGFVNIAVVMEKAPQAEFARKSLEKEFSDRDGKLTSSRDSILNLEDKLKREGDAMSATQRSELEREIVKRKRDFNRTKDELKEDFNIRRNEELGKLQRDIYDVILELARSEGYDLMVTERVLYASERIDITEAVLARLREAHE